MASVIRISMLALLALLMLLPWSRSEAEMSAEKAADLLAKASLAQAAGKLFAPGGNNAFEMYLEVSESDAVANNRPRRLTDSLSANGPQGRANYAITELLPSAIDWVKQAMLAGDLVEASRVIGLLERAQPESITVQRLRTDHGKALSAARDSLRSTDPERLPALVNSFNPKYPPRALRLGTAGWVHLSFTIKADGSVEDVEVKAAEPEGVFERNAVAALKKWKFAPGSDEVKAQQRFDFSVID